MSAGDGGGGSSSSSRQEGCGRGSGAAAETLGHFQDWCLRTYGDSAKTKTVTRRKYNKILQTLLRVDEGNADGLFLHDKASAITAKFKFWVRSKGFQVGAAQESGPASTQRPVLYVPIRNTVSGSAASSLLVPRCASFMRARVRACRTFPDVCGYSL